jgi:hypothetical protein
MFRRRHQELVMLRSRILYHCQFALFFVAIFAKAEPAPPSSQVLASIIAGAQMCSWPEVSGERLLARPVDSLSARGDKVEIVLAKLDSKIGGLPLSFIQADPEATVSLELRHSTVREVLDAIVAQAPGYRYRVVASHLVLYPRDPKWEMQLDLALGPAPRLQATRALAEELRRRLPAFADLAGPWVSGDPRSYTYQDMVTVVGPGSVLEILVQLLGNRPSTYLLLVKEDGWLGPSLSVSSIAQLRSIKLSTSKTILRQRDETAQLKLIGTLAFNGAAKNLTAGACGTVYTTSDESVLTVSSNGLVTVRGSGKAQVTASNEHYSDSMTFDCRVEGQ